MELQRLFQEHVCPVCGFQLGFMPWSEGIPADEICPCCGIQFGYDDARPDRREAVYAAWRQRWVHGGKRWWSSNGESLDFDPDAQLARLHRLMQ